MDKQGHLNMRFMLLLLALVLIHPAKGDTHYHAHSSLDEQITLLAQGEEFQTVYHPHMAPAHRGTIIFFASLMDPVGGKHGFAYLRYALSEKGYDSYLVLNNISIAAASEDIVQTPDDTAASDSATQTQSAPSEPQTPTEQQSYIPNYQSAYALIDLDTYKSRLQAQLESVMQRAAQTPKPVSIFAIGQGAGLLSEYLSEFPEIELQAMIALNSYLPDPERNRHIGANFSIIIPAVLDLYTTSAHSMTDSHKKLGPLWAQKNQKLDYRQVELLDDANNSEQLARLTTEIDGFLRRLF
ncbi:DUF3530 family protein [Pseudoalteromonas sp. SSDWG2]|uniref:DUF3530 family protein n=1 Tax=Pseudoalteromonas sp. SSDWG2 TaxID=3139391 RepID=UPI003BA88CFB